MASFLVMTPPRDRDHASAARIVRDGFSWLGLVLPVIWLAWRGLWVETILVFGAMLGIGAAAQALGYPGFGGVISLLLALMVALEGGVIHAASLRRRGWRDWGTVEARDAEEAELRFLAAEYGDEPADDIEVALPWQRHASSQAGPALGLFAYPGRR